jgi:hypothetical protein
MIRGVMKRVILVVLFVACSKETPAPPPPAPAPVPAARSTAPAVTPAHAIDYTKAVDWVRSAPAFHFDIAIGDVKASGDLSRARVGEERLQFKAKGDEWVAQRHVKGVTWTRNGKPDSNEPAYADRIYQWMTLFPDPAKSKPEVVGTEGDETHLRFTNLNTNETNDVWIRSDNHLARLKTSGAGSAFPAVEIDIR